MVVINNFMCVPITHGAMGAFVIRGMVKFWVVAGGKDVEEEDETGGQSDEP